MALHHTLPRSPAPRRVSHERGQDLAEFAFILPLLLLLTLGIIQFGILVWNYNTISNAAREGARYGIVHPFTDGDGTCDAPGSNSILAAACELTTGLVPSAITVETSDDCSSSNILGCISVTVSYDAELILGPLFSDLGIPGTLGLSSTATMDREQ